jgi:hypothetical protein
MADATVLNTVGQCPCGFESRLRHTVDLGVLSTRAVSQLLTLEEPN